MPVARGAGQTGGAPLSRSGHGEAADTVIVVRASGQVRRPGGVWPMVGHLNGNAIPALSPACLLQYQQRGGL